MTQDSTMALGADFISDLFETPNTLAHKGVKGMKWGKHKAQPPTTAPSSTIDGILNKYSETAAEAQDRRSMVDEYMKTKGKDSGTKKAGGKGGGKGGGGKKGGGKKGGAKKGSKKPTGSGGSGGSRASSNNAPAKTYEPRKNSYAPRKAITDILASIPKNLGPKAPKASVQAIIDKINASVDARKALQHKLLTKSEGGDMSGASDELVTLDNMDDILAHYGILGMKWGVRNDDRGSGRPQGGPSKKKAPLASVKKAVTKSPASSEEIVNKFYAKHTPKSMEFTMKDSATGKESFPIKYDEKILKRMSDQQNHAVFQPQKGVPKEVAEKELAYIKSQMKAASESLNAKTPETEKTTQGNRISDDELRAVINRLQMEKTYNQLMAERNPPAPKKAESAILKILRDSTRQAAGEILKGTVTAVGKYAIAAAISRKNPALATAILSKNEGNWAPKDESQNGSNSNKQSKTTTSTTDMTPSDIVQQIVDEMEKRRAASSTNP